MSTKKENSVNSLPAEVVEQSANAINSFVFMDEVKEVLSVSEKTGKNVILYGRGGYGKSDFSLLYNRSHGIEPFVFTMGSGTDTDRLFGGIDLELFNKTGKIEFLVENSFMNHEHVIFEELLDAPDFILEQLKDILSSGVFRNGSQSFPIKTKRIICCTNKTRDEFAKNNSLKALMERFPLEVEVKWNAFTRQNYTQLFDARFGKNVVDPMLPYILESFAQKGTEISPRIAIAAAEVLLTSGPESLRFIAEFGQNMVLLKSSLKKFEDEAQLNTLMNEAKKLVDEIDAEIDIVSAKTLVPLSEKIKEFNLTVKKIEKLKVSDEIVVAKTKFVDDCKEKHTAYGRQISAVKAIEELI